MTVIKQHVCPLPVAGAQVGGEDGPPGRPEAAARQHAHADARQHRGGVRHLPHQTHVCLQKSVSTVVYSTPSKRMIYWFDLMDHRYNAHSLNDERM